MTSLLVVIAVTQCAFAAALVATALVARLGGLRVDRVAIGYGRPLVVLGAGETRWQLGMTLLGGFVQIAGRDASDRSVALDDPRAFHNRPLLLRALVPLIFPVVLTLAAGMVMASVHLVWGVPGPGPGVILDEVVAATPAERGGLRARDELVSIDGNAVSQVSDVPAAIDAAKGRPVHLLVRRGGATFEHEVTPERDGGNWRIGVKLGTAERWSRQAASEAVIGGLVYPFTYDRYVLRELGRTVAGHEQATMMGPVGLVRVIGDRSGARDALALAAVVCAYLGMLLLVPVPPYSAGRVLLTLSGWRSRRHKVRSPSEDLGLRSLPRSRFPWALLGVLIPLGLMLLSVAALVRRGPLVTGGSLVLLAGVTVALGLGRPRAWILAVNALMVDLASLAALALTSPQWLFQLVLALAMLLVLWLPAVRRWFGHACPACDTLGARPVWSQARRFGCVRCGSCWTSG